MATVSGLDTLKNSGAAEISARTHISRDNIEALLEGQLGKFTPVQFQGFVSILEREYGIDLEALRDQYAQTAPQEEQRRAHASGDPFVISVKQEKRRKRNLGYLLAVLAVVVTLAVLVLLPENQKASIELNNTAIDVARANMDALELPEEQNSTFETVDAVQETRQEAGAEVESAPEPKRGMTLFPRSRVWVGMIDADSHEHFTKTTGEAIVLDANRTWLAITGHGFVTVECGDSNTTYKESDRLLLLYEDGECRRLDSDEFRLRNQGKMW